MTEDLSNSIHEMDEGLERLDLWNLVEPLLKNRWAVTLIVTGAFLLGVLYNLHATPIYGARSSLVIRRNYPTAVIRQDEASLPDKLNTFWDFNTKVSMITSRPLAEELVKRLIEAGHFKTRLEAINYASMSSEDKSRFIRAKAGIIGGVRTRNLKDTNIVTISYQSPDPVLARDVVNFLADIVVEFDRKEQMRILNNSLSYLNGQMDEARKRMEEAEGKMYEYRLKHDIFYVDMDRELMGSRRARLVQKLTEAKQSRRQLESQIAQLSDLLNRKDYTKYTPVWSGNQILVDLSNRLVSAEIKYEELMLRYQEKYPDVIRAKEEIKILKQKFEEEVIKTQTKLNYDLNVVKSQEKLLEGTLAETEHSAVISTEKDIEYVVLEREASSARELYRTLLAAVKEVTVNTNSLTEYVMYTHEKALLPKRPIKPNKPLNLIISLMLGTILAGAFAFGREYLDQTVRHPDDIKKSLNVPVLSTVPLHSRKSDEGKERDIAVHVRDHPKSLFSESITSLRSYLNIKLPQEKSMAIMVTSSAPREGKSLISTNLATSMALEGKKTLIIDADLHHPMMHKVFNIENNTGLFNLIVEALNPHWSDLDMGSISFGDLQHLIRLKQWSGTIKIQWDSLSWPLAISFKEGRPVGANIKEWKERFSRPSGFPPPENPSFSIDESEIADLDSTETSGKQALEFIHQYPRLCRSTYFINVAAEKYIKDSGIKNLHILTAGTNARNPSEILGSEQMRIALQFLRERYDRIIIDSPPAFPLSDVSVLSPMTDGIMWICRCGEVPRSMLQHNVQQIQHVQPNILGVVINALDLKRDRYYYYGYSSYYYYRRYYRYRYSYYYEHEDEAGEKKKSSLPAPG